MIFITLYLVLGLIHAICFRLWLAKPTDVDLLIGCVLLWPISVTILLMKIIERWKI